MRELRPLTAFAVSWLAIYALLAMLMGITQIFAGETARSIGMGAALLVLGIGGCVAIIGVGRGRSFAYSVAILVLSSSVVHEVFEWYRRAHVTIDVGLVLSITAILVLAMDLRDVREGLRCSHTPSVREQLD